jgi:TadE-like protein
VISTRHKAHAGKYPRGQALVEMAIILPLLAVLLVMAVDAGRVFFGYVALTNASRIGADYAASHAEAWNGIPTAQEQNQLDRYESVVAGDLQALGCQGNPVPDPNFDPDGDGTESFADGSLVRVELDCDFHPLTPLAEIFMGQPLKMRASSDFAINRTISAALPPPGVTPPPPSGAPSASASASAPPMCTAPDFDGPVQVRRNQAQALWTAAGFTTTLVFQGNGNFIIQGQSPLEGGQSGPCNTVETVANVPI